MKLLFTIFALFILSVSCRNEVKKEVTKIIPTPVVEKTIIERIKNRALINIQLENKRKKSEPIIAHILVPLCDNKNQGIVPTSPKLGNGLDLRNNLYWGVRHGMKTVFKKDKKWELLKDSFYTNSTILERVIYKRKFKNNATVIIVLDAYRGDKMKECLEDYFNSLAENKMDSITIDSLKIPIYGNADLVGFNGHNGLMDTEINYTIPNKEIRQKDAISISCQSSYYFNPRFEKINAYPLVVTTNNLYPGGFIIKGIIEKWAIHSSDEKIRQEAGNEYHRVKKCGIKGARKLFQTGFSTK